MRKDCAPYFALITNLNGLACGCVHLSQSVLFHADLKGGFMDQDPRSLCIIPQSVARDSIAGVQYVTVLGRYKDGTVGLSAVIDLNHAELLIA